MPGELVSSYKVEDKKQVSEFDAHRWAAENPDGDDDYSEEEEESVPCPVCNLADREDVLLLCDGCDAAYHTYCIGLDCVPPSAWYCMECVHQRQADEARRARRSQLIHRSGASGALSVRTAAGVRNARRRRDNWDGAWDQIAGSSINIQSDSEDEDVGNGHRLQHQLAERSRDRQRWQERLNIATRAGTQNMFTGGMFSNSQRRAPSNPLENPSSVVVRGGVFRNLMSSGVSYYTPTLPPTANPPARPLSALPPRQPPRQPEETTEEKQAWRDFTAAMQQVNTESRKRKVTPVSTAPGEPAQEQEEPVRRFKRPCTRRVPVRNGEASSSSQPALPSTPPAPGAASGTNRSHNSELDRARSQLRIENSPSSQARPQSRPGSLSSSPSTPTSRPASSSSNRSTPQSRPGSSSSNRARPLNSPSDYARPQSRPGSSSSNHARAGSSSSNHTGTRSSSSNRARAKNPTSNHARSGNSASNQTRPGSSVPASGASRSNAPRGPPQATATGPSFLSSILKEVESSTPSDNENIRKMFGPIPGANDPSSPAASSPPASVYSSPRALSTTPPVPRFGRPTSPNLTLSSHIEPIYPPANYSPTRASPENRDVEHRGQRPSASELRHPQPQRTHTARLPRSQDVSPSNSPLPIEMKRSINNVVRGALKPHWECEGTKLTKEQYAIINRDVSRKLYEGVVEGTSVDEAVIRNWNRIAKKEVSRAVSELEA